MNILFLTFHGFDPSNGISKKISYQIDAFRSLGHEVHICYMEETATKRRVVDGKVIADYGNGFLSKIKKRTEFSSIAKYARSERIDFVYIRSNHNANLFTISLIRQLKESGIKVVMEIPTFPYDSEYENSKMKRQLIQDKIFRYKFASLLDAIVTFSDDDFIFGQRTIKISNGIDFNQVRIKNQKTDFANTLNLIGVAEIHEWHGFDRVIQGLANYYKERQDVVVHFHIVGYFFSKEIEKDFIDYIHSCGVERYVTLYGRQHGEELDAIFDKCDFGIGSLGRHRVGIKKMKSLKNREYAARGIPFAYAEEDEDFDYRPYILKCPADDSPIDIKRIVSFYQQLKITSTEIRDSIQSLSWKNQMKRVLDETRPKSKSKETIRLAYCIPSLDRASGMERVLTLKANYLADSPEYEVNIITTDNKGSKPFFQLSEKVNIIQLDVNIDCLWKYPIWKRIPLYLRKKKEYKDKLEKCLQWLQADITISLMRREINFINSLKDGSRKFGEIHFGRYKYREINIKYLPNCVNKFLSALWMSQLIKEIKKLDKFIVLTHEDASYWKGISNICVIHNPITISCASTSSLKTKQVIAVGRYTYQKGFDLLIQAWEEVAKKHKDWSLHIYGAGDKSSYEELTHKYAIQDSVFCHGTTTNITEKYLESSIFVLSSRFEGFGLVIAEAMSVGLPCVSFDCPCGPKDIIKNNEDGLLCPNGNVGELSHCICKLIEDDQLRHNMGIKAKQNVQRFTIEHIMAQWDKLFRSTKGKL